MCACTGKTITLFLTQNIYIYEMTHLQAKIEMYSKYERQKDKRMYSERHVVFHGPTWLFAPERIKPDKTIEWDENTGLPSYVDMPGGEAPQEEVAAEEEE